MSDSFDRGLGVGQDGGRGGAAPLSGVGALESGGGAYLGGSGAHSSGSAEQQPQTGGLFFQQEPLRPPKTAPLGTGSAEHLQQASIPSGSQDKVSVPDSGPEMAESQVAVAHVVTSKLSVKAPEFYPSGYNHNFNQNFARPWESGEVPEDWKLANVVPVYKKGTRDDPGNYSAILQLVLFCRTLEKMG